MVIFSTESLILQTQIKLFTRIVILIPGFYLFVKYSRLKKSKIAVIFTFIFLSFLCILNGPENIINTIEFITLICLISLIDISNDINIFYKSTLWGIFSAIVIVLLLVYLGIFENIIYYDQLGRTRYFCGFSNSNYFSLYVFSFSVLFFFLKRNKKSLFISIIILFGTTFFTGSRTPLYSFVIFLLLCPFFKKGNIKFKQGLGFFLVIIILIAYIYFSLNYEKFVVLDILLSHRLLLINRFINDLSLKEILVGGNNPTFPIDNSYLRFLMHYGILFLLGFLCVLFFKIRNNNYDHIESAFVITMLAFGIFESVLISPGIPVSILFWYLILLK